ncbi:MAG TPA: hypothetical protein VG186_07080 [Solirubrobacteraceae bacterium]|nr:hypothetical protein [Solirubrobacteraceae bacterium]
MSSAALDAAFGALEGADMSTPGTKHARRRRARPSPVTLSSPVSASSVSVGEQPALITMLASERVANITGAKYVIGGGLIKTT